MFMNLKNALELQDSYIISIGGWFNLTEFDKNINRINRLIIRTYKRKYKKVFLGEINRKNVLTEYKKGMVYNFGCDFIVKEDNGELENMLFKFNSMKHSDPMMEQLNKIYAKVEELNGIILKWV